MILTKEYVFRTLLFRNPNKMILIKLPPYSYAPQTNRFPYYNPFCFPGELKNRKNQNEVLRISTYSDARIEKSFKNWVAICACIWHCRAFLEIFRTNQCLYLIDIRHIRIQYTYTYKIYIYVYDIHNTYMIYVIFV